MFEESYALWMANDIEREIKDYIWDTTESDDVGFNIQFAGFSRKKGRKSNWVAGWPPVKVKVTVKIERA